MSNAWSLSIVMIFRSVSSLTSLFPLDPMEAQRRTSMRKPSLVKRGIVPVMVICYGRRPGSPWTVARIGEKLSYLPTKLDRSCDLRRSGRYIRCRLPEGQSSTDSGERSASSLIVILCSYEP